MRAEQVPYPAGWWSFELPRYRPCDGTYCLFPYASIPPLDVRAIPGGFQWLATLDDALEQTMRVYRPPEPRRQRLAVNLRRLAAEAGGAGVNLPQAFVQFMRAPGWQDQIPSCTACYFDLSERLIAAPRVKDGYLIRFLNDQQGVLLWYLFASRAGGHCVVASPIWLDDAGSDGAEPGHLARHIYFCAPTFEEFIYRFWLENNLWFALEAGRPLTGEQQRYVAHYGEE